MKFEELLAVVGGMPYFDLATVAQMFDEARASLRTQLSRWARAGKLIILRRGMYALGAPYRRVPVHAALLANHLYRPSYISLQWALSFYGLIPEKTVIYTSVSPRVPRRFENDFGVFDYRNLKQSAFFGFRPVLIQQDKIMMAEPEKALLDLWHLSPGKWTPERMREMRFQNHEQLDPDRLRAFAQRYESPRLVRAVTTWQACVFHENEGTVEL
jgi:predicted transcriptional regulator of viral defense system